MKKAKQLRASNMGKCIGCNACMLACARFIHKNFSPQKSAIQIRTQGGMQTRFTANICRACINPPCAEACPQGALVPRAGGGVSFQRNSCIGCQKCLVGCPIDAIVFDEGKNSPIICIHCGKCVQFCPHQCLSLEEVTIHVE